MPTPEESQRMIARLRTAWEAQVSIDGKFYFPCVYGSKKFQKNKMHKPSA
jgi:hypothetical protein